MEQLAITHQPLSQALENTIIISLVQSVFLAIDLVIVLWCLRRFPFAATINRYRITVLAYSWLFGSTIWIFLHSFQSHQQNIIDNETFELLALSMPDALDKFLYFRQSLTDFAALNVKWWLLIWYIALLVWASYFLWRHKNEKIPPLSSQRENIILYSLLVFISFNPIAWWLMVKIRHEGKFTSR